METLAAPGFFGKMPAHGDFVQRNISNEFISQWDNWLQRAFANSQEQLQEVWLDAFLTSPIWRFALSPGALTDQGWVGIMIPSVDSVGRYYPMTFASPVTNGQHIAIVFAAASNWFQQLENLAATVLEQQINNEQLVEILQDESYTQIINLPEGFGVPGQSLFIDDKLANGRRFTFFLSQLWLSNQFVSYSLWQSQGSDRVPAGTLVYPSMLGAEHYVTLLDPSWQPQ